jgi:transcriptional regulator with XRE-family HTH domain
MLGGDLIREARRRAGFTQAELAVRAGTTQSGIARWESGRTSPSLDDVRRLIRLCGFDLEVAIVPYDGSDMAQAERLFALTPQKRVEWNQRAVRQMTELRKAGRGA